jgi:predicted site-specific integrase-resolvase
MREKRNLMLSDPLLPLRDAMTLMGNPSYTSVRSWIKTGKLNVWRVGTTGHYKVRMSEVERFLDAHEVKNAQS